MLSPLHIAAVPGVIDAVRLGVTFTVLVAVAVQPLLVTVTV